MNETSKVAVPTGFKARTGTKGRVSKQALRAGLNPNGSTVISDFARVIREEPIKYIYTLKIYLKRKRLPEPIMQWLRDRYIDSNSRSKNHGTRYEVRTYKATNGKRYVDYMLLEQMTEEEKVMFTLEFGEITTEVIKRDGKLRRPRLNKEEKKEFDAMVNAYYLDISAKRRAEEEAAAAAKA